MTERGTENGDIWKQKSHGVITHKNYNTNNVDTQINKICLLDKNKNK